jgi:sugar phosphate permease
VTGATTSARRLFRPRTDNPWNALWALLVGFFMILLDATIVAVANPSIMDALGADYDAVIWVTSAYLLAYAVPLLLAGRLGDRFGPRNLYLAGLAVFTAASLWCGLAGSIEVLVAARVHECAVARHQPLPPCSILDDHVTESRRHFGPAHKIPEANLRAIRGRSDHLGKQLVDLIG